MVSSCVALTDHFFFALADRAEVLSVIDSLVCEESLPTKLRARCDRPAFSIKMGSSSD